MSDESARLSADTVYIVYGVYSDNSGSMILGVYKSQHDAEDRVTLAREGGSYLSISYAKAPVGKAFKIELRS